MRIFVLGVGGTGSLLVHLLVRQGHTVWCGDRDVERAHRFLGKQSKIRVDRVNARNLWSIVRAARSCHLLVNASPAVFNEVILRAALRLRAHYLDMNSHLTRNPFKPEQLRFHKRFMLKNRTALISAGVSPGLTNLLMRRSSDMLDAVDGIYLRLYESTESADPVSTWSADAAFDAAVSRPVIYRQGRFHFGKRFGERELFRFPAPISVVPVYLAAQDEVSSAPHMLPLREMDAKIGGKDIEQLRRWYRQGKLSRSRGLVRKRFPKTPTPRMVARLIRRGILENARFAAAVLVRGMKNEEPLLIRWDAAFPTLYQLRARGLLATPISYATAHMAALFVKYLPRDFAGVHPPGQLPEKNCRAILAEVKSRDIRISMKLKRLKRSDDEEPEF